MSSPPQGQGVDAERNGFSKISLLNIELRPRPQRRSPKKTEKARRARLRRRDKIQRAADRGVEVWSNLEQQFFKREPAVFDAPVLRPLSRPQPLEISRIGERLHSALPPPRRQLDFKAGVFKSFGRLFVWTYAAAVFALSMLWDRLNGRDPQENGPRRLRETFERMGTTFIKIGQQLSMRLDLLPDAYTTELSKMLDNVPPFPAPLAIQAIERATRCPLDEAFSAFDSDPIGSASVACVYQAMLKTGERVAVKVRRPRIGPLLAADMRALPWILKLIELVRFTPGFFAGFSAELRMMLMEELDFNREAQFAELYRRKMRKTKQLRFVHVPKVFFEYSNDEVLVTEFATGIWLNDVLPALERHPEEMIARLEEMNCDRIILARRIQLIARFNNFENIFFHADLHPANVLVQPGNNLVLIDFGSCGSFNTRELNSWRRWYDAQSVDDVAGMVQAALAIIEPVPPIDRDVFGQELEVKFWNDLYAIKSKHSNWSERISSRLWYGFLELSRKHQIPMRLNTLRMIRASMLTDTIAIRLDPDQDPYREFRYYEKAAGKRAKKRVIKRVRRLMAPRSFISLEHGLESGLKLIYQLQRTVESLSTIRVQDIITRFSYFFQLLVRHIVWIMTTLGIGTVAVLLWRIRSRGWGQVNLRETFVFVLTSPWWLFVAASPYVIVFSRLFRRAPERKPWDN